MKYEVAVQMADKSIMRIICHYTELNTEHQVRFLWDKDFKFICCTWEQNVVSVDYVEHDSYGAT